MLPPATVGAEDVFRLGFRELSRCLSFFKVLVVRQFLSAAFIFSLCKNENEIELQDAAVNKLSIGVVFSLIHFLESD